MFHESAPTDAGRQVAVVVLMFGGYMTLLNAIAVDVDVTLLVTINGLKLLPQTNEGSGIFLIAQETTSAKCIRSWNTCVGLPARGRFDSTYDSLGSRR